MSGFDILLLCIIGLFALNLVADFAKKSIVGQLLHENLPNSVQFRVRAQASRFASTLESEFTSDHIDISSRYFVDDHGNIRENQSEVERLSASQIVSEMHALEFMN